MTLMAILILSMVGIAAENTEKANITVASKSLDIDKSTNKETVLITIDTSKTGHLNYIEKYYSKNDTGAINLDSASMYYNDTITNNTLTLEIKRPLNASGGQYLLIKAMVFIDNVRQFDSQFRIIDEQEEVKQTEQPPESPGFDIVVPIISIVSIVYLLKRRKTKI